ncbi:1-pyrroline-5-carboxylate dehydrogenase [Vibrio sp. EA2]|uniref:1-pyrroline-5-carboxylate dehydrogenase n=1 Tax=Vibrio sp. EA2 TaxID=3079860 RepID=UPI002949A958|nr:1-pyrroline-5-carboxylate dehydrogenase [Vibrio sp. EA2]MDV6252880.1 1-pyrroline-5-carboxylate dehydrogenase [Vibrio sp. EA2]
MKPLLDIYSASSSAFGQWSLTDFTLRKEKLVGLGSQLPKALQNVLQYHLTHAELSIASTQSLVSPTGETNELYTQGRGVSVLLIDSDEANSQMAFMAMVTALLATGNSVIICSNNLWVKDALQEYQYQQLLPEGLVSLIPKDGYHELITHDIRSFVFIGNASETVEINEALSMRPNAITSLVAETDLEALLHSKDPMLALRFITEKVRSINITAIGGNATLLELGNTTH